MTSLPTNLQNSNTLNCKHTKTGEEAALPVHNTAWHLHPYCCCCWGLELHSAEVWPGKGMPWMCGGDFCIKRYSKEDKKREKRSGQVSLHLLCLQPKANIKTVRQRSPWRLLPPCSNTSVMLKPWGKRLAAPENKFLLFSLTFARKFGLQVAHLQRLSKAITTAGAYGNRAHPLR